MNKKITYIILTIIAIIIAIAGLVLVCTKGFKKDSLLNNSEKIVVTIDSKIDANQVKEVFDEITGDDSVVQSVEIYGDSVAITSNPTTEEQRQAFVDKINEIYYADVSEDENYSIDDLSISTVGTIRIRDLLKPLVLPLFITTCIIVVYFAILYRKQNLYLVIIKTIATFMIVLIELYSILAITRFPIGDTTIPLTLVAYILAALGLSIYFEKNANRKPKKVEKEQAIMPEV